MAQSAQFIDATQKQIVFNDTNGISWSGIPCTVANGAVTLTTDGEVPDKLKAWLALGNVVAPYVAPPITVAQVVAERERRMALGFNYTFPDARGTHHIGTTPADMVGWDEVTKATQAMVALGSGTSTFGTIVTDTGSAVITALEWQSILISATLFRQPLWSKSFALQAMTPIPADYAADARWA